MKERIIGTENKDKVIAVLKEYACNPDDLSALVCATVLRQIVEEELCKTCTEWRWIQRHAYHSNNLETLKED